MVYGRPSPTLLPYTAGAARMDAVDVLLWDHHDFLTEVRECLLQAQQYTNRYYK